MIFKNIFNFRKNEEEISDDESRKKSLRTLIVYGVFFALVMILARFGGNNNNNNSNNGVVETKENIVSLLQDIDVNNYEANVNITADDDILLVEYRKDDSREIIAKKYRDEDFNYLKVDDTYYEVDLEAGKYNIVKDVKVYNEYDTTFINIGNVIKFVNVGKRVDLEEEDYNIARYKIPLSAAVDVYNQINTTDYKTENQSEVVIDINYSDNLKNIIFDATNIYNIIKNTAYNKLTYTLSFDKIGEIDLSNLNMGDS